VWWCGGFGFFIIFYIKPLNIFFLFFFFLLFFFFFFFFFFFLCVCVCPGFPYEHAIGLLICFQFISEIQFLVWLFFFII
jgi:hypothetical protein